MKDFFGYQNSELVDVPVVIGESIPPRIERVIDPTLKTMLQDWVDWDVASFFMGVSLGLYEGTTTEWFKYKGTFWSNNVVGSMLMSMLNEAVRAGVLESGEDGTQFRWKQEAIESQADYESEQIAKARKLIADHLNADEGFRLGYEANIAMLLYDQYGIKDEKKRNQAAKDLLKLIFE